MPVCGVLGLYKEFIGLTKTYAHNHNGQYNATSQQACKCISAVIQKKKF